MMSAEILRIEGEISQLEKEWTAIYVKAQMFDWLTARMKSVETFDTFIDLATWNDKEKERAYYRGETLAEAVRLAMDAEGER